MTEMLHSNDKVSLIWSYVSVYFQKCGCDKYILVKVYINLPELKMNWRKSADWRKNSKTEFYKLSVVTFQE